MMATDDGKSRAAMIHVSRRRDGDPAGRDLSQSPSGVTRNPPGRFASPSKLVRFPSPAPLAPPQFSASFSMLLILAPPLISQDGYTHVLGVKWFSRHAAGPA